MPDTLPTFDGRAVLGTAIKDTDGLQRVHTLIAGTATFVDGDIVRRQIDEQAEKIEMAARLAKGERKFPLPEELRGEHLIGDHASALVEGCPLCQEEADAVAAEEAAYADATAQGVPLVSIDGGAQTPKRVRPSRKEAAARREAKAAAETGEA